MSCTRFDTPMYQHEPRSAPRHERCDNIHNASCHRVVDERRNMLPSARRGEKIVLDGGMGHLLRRKGIEIVGEIGSMQRFLGVALANTERPDIVREAHLEYLEAGATVITTNSYACVPAALGTTGDTSWDLVAKNIAAAGECACKARESFKEGRKKPDAAIKVAGCLPPLHESYRPDKVGPDDENSRVYRKIVDAIAPFSDLLLCETMSSVRESVAAAEAASSSSLPVWISWTLHDDGSGNLRSCETIQEAVQAVANIPNVVALLVNCASHKSICAALSQIKKELGEESTIAVGAYANGFVSVVGGAAVASEARNEYRDLSAEDYAEQAKEYWRLGASIVGGCCGVFPEHIEAVAEASGVHHSYRRQVEKARTEAEVEPKVGVPCGCSH